jgi:hypothetical protein
MPGNYFIEVKNGFFFRNNASYSQPSRPPLKPLTFECAWKNDAPDLRDTVKDLWRTYRALDGEERLEERSREIVFLVRNAEGAIVGVSTARPVQMPLLNNNYFYEFRCFIAPPFRAAGLDSMLAAKTKAFLATQEDSIIKYKGLVIIIQNKEMRQQRTKAVWPASGMVFAGYTAQGYHIRVGYFKGARI